MKRLFLLLYVGMLCMWCASAQAVSSKEEWDVTSLYTMGSSATVYELIVEEIPVASGTDLQYTFNPIGTVSAGAMVTPTGESDNGKNEIAYWSGGRQYGYVDPSSYYYNATSVTGSNGKTYRIPNTVLSSDALLRWSISLRYSSGEVDIVLEALSGGGSSGDSGEEGEGSSGSSSAKKKVTYTTSAVTWTNEEGEEQTVTIEELGTVNTVIRVGKEKMTVPTAELHWETEAPENKVLASIYAPKGGTASLRSKSSTKASVLKKIDTNRLVLVLKTGKNFTKVVYDGIVGYVITSALKFYPVGGVTEDTLEGYPKPGYVTFRGRLNSRNTVNIRMNGKNGSRILTDFIAGTPIMVFNQEGKWSEIDVGGYRAFILSEYVTLEEDLETEANEEE